MIQSESPSPDLRRNFMLSLLDFMDMTAAYELQHSSMQLPFESREPFSPLASRVSLQREAMSDAYNEISACLIALGGIEQRRSDKRTGEIIGSVVLTGWLGIDPKNTANHLWTAHNIPGAIPMPATFINDLRLKIAAG